MSERSHTETKEIPVIITEEQKIMEIINPILEKHCVAAFQISEELLNDLVEGIKEYGEQRRNEGVRIFRELQP
jgi:hypothetical protein